jgi:hypothetical protein
MAKFPLTVRDKNLAFLSKILEAFLLDSDKQLKSLVDYKKAFTAKAVRDLHEEIIRLWPKTIDIARLLRSTAGDVSGLYIGDYSPEHLMQGIVRHSLYASKLLIADPFIYPHSVRDEYNPILNPEQYRTQTLRNVNLWITLAPWIQAGIVEVIRTPADFDHRLQWDSMKEQDKKFSESPELQQALQITVEELRGRHIEKWKHRDLLLSLPDDALMRRVADLADLADPAKGITAEGLLAYVRRQRDNDPDFLEPAKVGEENAQLTMITSGPMYNVARLTASLTGSYLMTDLSARWKEIELDRAGRSSESDVWSPFAKAFQGAEFRYLNNVRIEDAFRLRQDERLNNFRSFLRQVWKQACDPRSFDKVNGHLLADELQSEVAKAKAEWDQIDQDLLNAAAVGAGTGLVTSAPLIGSGQGIFLAAAAVVGGAAALAASTWRRARFPDKFPAAFFLRLGGQK